MGESALAKAFKSQKDVIGSTRGNSAITQPESSIAKVYKQIGAARQNTQAASVTPNYGQGNIDLNAEPMMPNLSKKYTIYADAANGKKVVIPLYDTSLSVADAMTHSGLTQEQAEEQYRKTGKYYAAFDAPELVGTGTDTASPLEALQQQMSTGKEGNGMVPNVDLSRNTTMPGVRVPTANNDDAEAFVEAMEFEDYKKKLQQGGPISNEEIARFDVQLQKERFAEIDRERYGNANADFWSGLSLAVDSGAENFMDGLRNVGAVPYLNNTQKAMSQSLRDVAAEERMEMGTVAGFFFDMTQNLVQNAPAMVTGFAGGKTASFMTTYLSSYGRSKEYAEEHGYEGASKYAYAVLNGLQEAGLDYVGRMPGGGNLTGAVADALTKNITKSLVKFGAKLAISAAGEGITEMFQEVIDNGLKNTLFGENNNTSLFSEEALYAGLLGAATGGLFETVETVSEVVGTKRAEATKRKAEKQAVKKMIKDLAIETGIKRGVSEEVYTEVAEVASELGRPVRFASDEELQITKADGTVQVPTGQYDHDTKTILLSTKLSKQEAIEFVVKHELAHSIQGTPQWTQLEQAVRTNMGEQAFLEAVQAKTEQYAKNGIRLDPTRAEQEVVADWIGDNLYNGRFFEAVKGGDATGGNVVRRTIDRIRLALGGIKNSRTAGDIALLERLFMRGIQEVGFDGYDLSQVDAEDGAENTSEKTIVYFIPKGEDETSVKEQLREKLDEINSMDPVANILYQHKDRLTARKAVSEVFKKIGYQVDRQNFGKIVLGEDEIDLSVDYVHTPAECAAWLAVPKVLKRGKIIHIRDNHKVRGHGTVTIAAPVIINNVPGVMAVLVKETGKSRYKAHRILMPDGSAFAYQDAKNAEPTSSGVTNQNGGEGPNISSASDTRVSQNSFGVNSNDMQNGEKNSQSSADFYGTFVGDEGFAGKSSNSQAVGKAEHTETVQPFSAVKNPAIQSGISENVVKTTDTDAVHNSAVERAKQMPQEKTVASGKTIAELEQELSERELFNRAFMSEVVETDRPPATMEIDGNEVRTDAYMDAVEEMLPDTEEGVQEFIENVTQKRAKALAQELEETGEVGSRVLPINIQLFAAQRKLERIRLLKGEEGGTEMRRFFEQRLKNLDANDNHAAELVEYLAGRDERYSPIANEKTLENAKKKLREDGYRRKLERRIKHHRAGDTMNAEDLAAAQVMINDAKNDGDLEMFSDLIQGVSRYGTDLGRAVQILSLQRRLTPEGTIKAVQRTMQKAIDEQHGEGAGEGIDRVSGTIVDAIERVEEHSSQNNNSDFNPEGATVDQLEDALGDAIVKDKTPYISEEQIRGIIHRAVDNATDMKKHLKKMLQDPKTEKALAEKIAYIHSQGHLTDGTVRAVVEEALGLPRLSTEDVEQLVKLVEVMQNTEDGTLERMDAQEAIYRFLGERLPVTKSEALMSWRKFAMLANPKTHIRNILSNVVMQKGINKADDAIATVLQKRIIKDPQKRTALVGWRCTEFGKKLLRDGNFEKAAERALVQLRGLEKYEMTDRKLAQYKRHFEALFGKRVGRFFDNLSDTNSEWLETEDAKSFVPAFKDALGQVMTVREATEITDEIFDIAFQKAAETVFRTENAMATVLSQMRQGMFNANTSKGKKALGYITDIVMPFSKTPANIAVVSFQHSPFGLVKGGVELYRTLKNAKNAKTAAEAINEISKGLTGSALFLTGVLMGISGLFNTKYGKTEKERAADELAGIQENALVLPDWLGGFSISLDWLQPTGAPLIMGASFGQRLCEDGLDLGSVGNSVLDATDTLFELSMLQSLYDVLGGYNAGASATAVSVGENFISQSIPTVFGQVARAVDPVQRKTTGDNDFQTIINQVLAKIPGLTYLLEPELDVWGNEVYRTGKVGVGSALLNVLQQTISPANIKIPISNGDFYSQLVLDMYNSPTAEKTSRAIPSSVTRDDAQEMGVDYDELFRIVAQMQRERLEELVDDNKVYSVQVTTAAGKKRTVKKRWSSMTEDERLRVMNRIYSEVKSDATDPNSDLYDDIVRRLKDGN